MLFRSIGGTPVSLVEDTQYPFRGAIRMTIMPEAPIFFPFELRIPSWAQGATIQVNGESKSQAPAGAFARIERKWQPGDRVEIVFPVEPRTSRWFHDSVAFERGPLVFSYGIGEDWVKLRDRGMTADWQVFPTTQWNYGISGDLSTPAQSVRVSESDAGDSVFTAKHAPVRLSVKARKIADWRAEDGAANPVPESPAKADLPEETITLIPYAAAKLRITAFPQCRT